MINYPIKFNPILKEKIWGGDKLSAVLNKKTLLNSVGESWEISSVDEDISVVENGALKGKTIVELIEDYKSEFLGERNYNQFGNKFPLLFKFIDAKENLSVQLHPNDKIAKERHDSFGKTEMWYVMDADEDAQLNVGFSEKMSPEKYKEALASRSILEKLNFENVKKGDAFFIKEGLVHAIGAGCLIAEIQQTSDITYRIYDWDRVDDEGNERELHTELALEALDYSKVEKSKCRYERDENKFSKVASCQYFTTNYSIITEETRQDLSSIDSFVVYVCVSGSGEIAIGNNKERIKRGETVLVPANTKTVVLVSEEMELLEVYV